jgi:ABC-2 type transport system permease protein
MSITSNIARQDRAVGIRSALTSELQKLAAQRKVRFTLLGCLLAPVIVTIILNGQDRPPKDTVYGRHLHTSGFAVALFVVTFASQWVLPAITALVAGEIFAGEDHFGTWKTLLTRSVSRRQVFVAKWTASALFATLATAFLGASTIASGAIVIGRQPLPGLTAQLIDPGRAQTLVIAAWASVLPPLLAITAIAMLLSVVTRSPAGGIAGTIVIALASQLVGWLGGIDLFRRFLPTSAFDAWHGFFTTHIYLDLFYEGVAVSIAWVLLASGIAYAVFRRRDITGG